MALFITFEGTEGCGKSTQIALLSEYLEQNAAPYVMTKEPGGSAVCKKIRELLLHSENSDIRPKAELLLYAADRAQHVEEILSPALREGKTVLCDRYLDATVAYQGYGRGLDLDLVGELNGLSSGGLMPDLTFLIDCPVETGIGRALKRAESEGSREIRFENEHISFHEKVKKGYMAIAAACPERVVVVDGTLSVEKLHETILEIYLDKAGSPAAGSERELR
ncbi:MAG: dTMP kinase [Deltaproteobacteria bacterium]|nr:dTMP kinase [Deltaproteobacteria bacterium]